MGRILGIDYGIKRIGLALSDPLGFTAQPLIVIERVSVKKDLEKICASVEGKEVSLIVMGLPVNMDGTPGKLVAEVEKFAAKLQELMGIPLEMYDERLTTIQSERFLVEEANISREKRRKVRDKLAASMILKSYLDQRR